MSWKTELVRARDIIKATDLVLAFHVTLNGSSEEQFISSQDCGVKSKLLLRLLRWAKLTIFYLLFQKAHFAREHMPG